jgi:hypothetical protein
MTGIVERKRWKLYDMEGTRLPRKSAGFGVRKVRKARLTVAVRLDQKRPPKFMSRLNDLRVAKPPLPWSITRIGLRRAVLMAFGTEI